MFQGSIVFIWVPIGHNLADHSRVLLVVRRLVDLLRLYWCGGGAGVVYEGGGGEGHHTGADSVNVPQFIG